MHQADRTRAAPVRTPEEQARIAAEDSADGRDFERCMEFIRRQNPDPVGGLYGPQSVTWEQWREPALLAAGLPAVLLQVAHPAIATGVAELSRYKVDMLGRAWRTMSSLYELIYSDLPTALAASRRLHLIHRRVRGLIRDPGGPLDGQPYRANEQHLLRWVGVTVSVSGLQLYERAVRPLTPEEKQQWFREFRIASAVVGILPENLPETLPALEAWYAQELESPALRVGAAARDIARTLFNTAATRGPFDEILCAGLLPPQWRDAYGLRQGRAEQKIFEAMLQSVRLFHRATPLRARSVVAWHQAQLRVARAAGSRESRLGRLLNSLDGRTDLPGSIRPIAPHAQSEAGGDPVHNPA